MTAQQIRIAWIQGGAARCKIMPPVPPRLFRLVLLGAPGVGKGTQAELLCERLGTCHLSTGDIFRAAKCLAQDECSPALQDALGYMRRGDLVPDQTVLDLLRERTHCIRCRGGFLLDGFPRTVAQAEAFDRLLAASGLEAKTVLFDVDPKVLTERLTGRWTNPRTGRVYHEKFNPPKVAGIDDEDGGELIQRPDDKEETIKKRLAEYQEKTAPLIAFYEKKGNLVRVDALADIATVTNAIVSACPSLLHGAAA